MRALYGSRGISACTRVLKSSYTACLQVYKMEIAFEGFRMGFTGIQQSLEGLAPSSRGFVRAACKGFAINPKPLNPKTLNSGLERLEILQAAPKASAVIGKNSQQRLGFGGLG